MRTELPADIAAFRKKHDACVESLEWTIANCKSMQDVWNKASPEWLIWVATRRGVLNRRTRRVFACWCVRQIWHLLTDDRSKHAVEVAERFINGEATREELRSATDNAFEAALDVASNAAAPSNQSAATAAHTAAEGSIWDTAVAAAWATYLDGAKSPYEDVLSVQADWLRKNTVPNFKEKKMPISHDQRRAMRKEAAEYAHQHGVAAAAKKYKKTVTHIRGALSEFGLKIPVTEIPCCRSQRKVNPYIVLKLREEGVSQIEIATQLQVSRQRINQYVELAREAGYNI